MPDYQKGKIYTIRYKTDNSKIYVGSTIQPLSHRFAQHKKDSKIKVNMVLYKTIKENWDDWYIELYELYPCNSKEELLKREGEVIREIGNLNKQIAGRTAKEYREDNKEQIKERHKEYVEQHKEHRKETAKIWYEMNKEEQLEKHKEYREKNKNKKKQIDKEYYEKNKEAINEYKKKWYEERKTKLHQQNLKQNNLIIPFEGVE